LKNKVEDSDRRIKSKN